MKSGTVRGSVYPVQRIGLKRIEHKVPKETLGMRCHCSRNALFIAVRTGYQARARHVVAIELRYPMFREHCSIGRRNVPIKEWAKALRAFGLFLAR